jgi:2-polyprenyl-3-methyl-5-hydroxy-6-metoxy-1,4-benzoquinol methylase
MMGQRASVRSTDVRDVYHAEYFLQRVDGYDRFQQFDGTLATLFDRARRNFTLLDIRPNDRVLDLGCGRGEVAIAAGVAGAVAVGCDFSLDAIRLAWAKTREIERRAGRGINTEFVCGIATEAVFKAGSFDKILMSEFVEHVAPSELAIILRNIRTWLRPGGSVVVYTFPNRLARRTYPLLRAYTHLLYGRDIGERPEDTIHPDYHKLHLNEQSYFSLGQSLRRAGFARVRVWFDAPHRKRNLLMLKETLLYQILFGYNLVARATKRA